MRLLGKVLLALTLLVGSATAGEIVVKVEADVTAIDTQRSGVYTAGDWTYSYIRTPYKGRREGRWGVLTYKGKALGYSAKLNDWHTTPWGPLYWWGVNPFPVSGRHLFMPEPNEGLPMGKRLNPETDVYNKE